jgi:hypothetical protein
MKKALLGASKRMRGEKSRNKSSLDEKKNGSVSSSKENSDGIVLEEAVRIKDQTKDQADEDIAVVTSSVVPSLTREERKRRHKTSHAPTTPSETIARNGDDDVRILRAEKALQKNTSGKGKITGEGRTQSKRPRVAVKRKLPSDYTTSIVVQIVDSPKQQRHSNIITRCYELVFCA